MSDSEKVYKFWGHEQADVSVIDRRYKGIETAIDLYDALCNLWSAETCAPRMRENWTRENMTLGQCSVTAFLVQDLCGGEVYGIPLTDGGYHCFNVVGDYAFDLTSEQFGDRTLVYGRHFLQKREEHFAKEEKRLRYELLKKRLEEQYG